MFATGRLPFIADGEPVGGLHCHMAIGRDHTVRAGRLAGRQAGWQACLLVAWAALV